jgi:hypothetical protein
VPAAHHPTDALVDELSGVYAAAALRLEGLVRAGLARGLDARRANGPDATAGDATHAYRQRQLGQVLELLRALDATATAVAPLVVGRAYGAGLHATDTVTGRKPREAFGTVHVRAVEALSANLRDSLHAATARTRTNVATVFERADELDGALPGHGRVGGVPFLGRRIDDPWRRVSLEQTAVGIASLDTRRQVSASLIDALIREGVTDAATGFVDRAGRRWSLEAYSAMVARTTTREAVTAATDNRMDEHALDLVTITSHEHHRDVCTPYDGKTFSRSGRSTRYPKLELRPPFHPNCEHVMAPATANLDDFEAELEAWARGGTPAVAKARTEVEPEEPTLADRYEALEDEALEAHLLAHVDPLTEEEARVAGLYSRGAYGPVNAHLRPGEEGFGGDPAKLDAIAATLDGAIAHQGATTQPGLLHRYLDAGDFGDVERGTIVEDRAFVSTSARSGVYGPKGKARTGDDVVIVAPPGTRGLWMEGLGIDGAAHEREYLLPRGSRFEVLELEDTPEGGRRIVVALLPPEPQAPPEPELSELAKRAAAIREAGGADEATLRELGGLVAARAVELAPDVAELDAARRELGTLQAAITEAISSGETDVDAAFARLAELRPRRVELEATVARLEGVAEAQRAEAYAAALAEARPRFGEGTLENLEGATADGRKLLEDAARYLPAEWLEASSAVGKVTVKVSRGRGLHQWRAGSSHSALTVRADDVPLALHELTHRLQHVVPGLADAERAFYRRRITDAKGKLDRALKLKDVTGSWGYAASEVTRGAWSNAYIGKDYAQAFERKLYGKDYVDPREVATMALEGIFGGRHDLFGGKDPDPRRALRLRERRAGLAEAYSKPADRVRLERDELAFKLEHEGDPELVHFALGLLAGL